MRNGSWGEGGEVDIGLSIAPSLGGDEGSLSTNTLAGRTRLPENRLDIREKRFSRDRPRSRTKGSEEGGGVGERA